MKDPLRNLPPEIESMRFDANGLDVHALVAGPADGELVLLLHGCPELSRSWSRQLVALGDSGYRAVAPDQRGYGATTRRGPYGIETLAAAARHSRHVRRLIVANCPPGQVMARAMRNPSQLKKSSYMFFFQLPVIPGQLSTLSTTRATSFKTRRRRRSLEWLAQPL